MPVRGRRVKLAVTRKDGVAVNGSYCQSYDYSITNTFSVTCLAASAFPLIA